MKPWVDCNSSEPIDQLVHVSRLVGGHPSLVLHSGGNTSIKAQRTDAYGQSIQALYIKGSGTSLATIEPSGFAVVDLEMVRRLLTLTELTDFDMVNELRRAMLDVGGPNPSLETILHAFLPHKVVLHTHADAFLAISNTPNGQALLEGLYGSTAVHVGYYRPGLPLALACAAAWENHAGPETIALLLQHHGVFTFGDTAKIAYERMAHVIDQAKSHVAGARQAEKPSAEAGAAGSDSNLAELAAFRAEVSEVAGKPLVMTRDGSAGVRSFLTTPNVKAIVGRGPVTPDHVIRTKPRPLVGRDVTGYKSEYEAYFATHQGLSGRDELVMLDPAPRVVLDQQWGLLTLGDNYAAARTANEVYRHSIHTMEAAESLGGFQPIGANDLFEVEYWSLEQAKLKLADGQRDLAGQVCVVTGAASGIGKACARALIDEGAAVCGIDIDAGVASTFDDVGWLGVQADVSDPAQIASAVASTVDRFGGIDIAVIGAGIFGTSTPIAELSASEWRQVMAVNVDSVVGFFQLLHPILAASPVPGRVVVIGSKNVPAPGKGAAAYSSSKAALVQLCRVAALEWAEDAIRVNMVHPDAVFDTGLWTPELLEERSQRYGLSVEEYKRRNLLGTEVSSAAVAALVTDMCGPGFAATTGAQVPIDGGSDRVI